MNNALTSDVCTEAAKRFVELGLEYLTLPAFSEPDHCSTAWCSRVDNALPSSSNIGLRGRDCGRGAFAIRVSVDSDPNRRPLEELESYRLLRGFGDLLRFETASTATFPFRRDVLFVEVSEHGPGYFDKVHTGPLKGVRFVSHWLGFGAVFRDSRAETVTCAGSRFVDIRELPELLSILKSTGRVRVYSL